MCSWIGRLNINSLQTNQGLNTFPIKIRARFFFLETDKLILECTQEGNITRIAKTIVKKNKVGRITLPDIKIYSNYGNRLLAEI